MVIEEKQKNGAQLFFTSNIENYIIKGELYGAQTDTMASGISGRAAD